MTQYEMNRAIITEIQENQLAGLPTFLPGQRTRARAHLLRSGAKLDGQQRVEYVLRKKIRKNNGKTRTGQIPPREWQFSPNPKQRERFERFSEIMNMAYYDVLVQQQASRSREMRAKRRDKMARKGLPYKSVEMW